MEPPVSPAHNLALVELAIRDAIQQAKSQGDLETASELLGILEHAPQSAVRQKMKTWATVYPIPPLSR